MQQVRPPLPVGSSAFHPLYQPVLHADADLRKRPSEMRSGAGGQASRIFLGDDWRRRMRHQMAPERRLAAAQSDSVKILVPQRPAQVRSLRVGQVYATANPVLAD